MTTDLDKMLSDAKIGTMIKGSRFLSTIIFSMKHVWNDKILTADTDGMTVQYNPTFFASLNKKQRVALIAHEAWHPALLHITRMGSKDPDTWCRAADYVVNQLLVDSGFELPPDGCQDHKYRGMSTDVIYDLLIQDKSPNAPKYDNDIVIPTSAEAFTQVDMKLKATLVKARTASEVAKERAGTIPAEVNRLIEELLNPVLPWTVLLADFLNEKVKEDFTWMKPNKRFMPDFIMPSQYSEGLGEITVAIDTSGSLSNKALTEILSEVQYIHESMKPSKLTIMDCDYNIHNIYEVTDSDKISELTFTGGGGTSFLPVFNKLKENPPQLLIYFTDLYAPQITEEPGYPVLWICCSKHEESPIGRTIYLN